MNSYPLLASMLHLCAQWYVAIGNFFDKAHLGVVKHNMEVLYSMYRFQRPPVLEPDDLCDISKRRW